ncbi:MAG: hypothetical protein LIO42_04070 [Oscillospiraceae bacterium]|nr:hypothetical protein [Oscillospiraceae bacterium]
MDRVTVGQRVQRAFLSFNVTDAIGKAGKKPPTAWGTVVYVHPKGRFHIVELPSGVRESFPGAAE